MLSNFFVQAEHKRNTILKKVEKTKKKALIIKQEQSRQYIYIFLKKRLKFVVDSIFVLSLSLSVVLKKFVVFKLQFFLNRFCHNKNNDYVAQSRRGCGHAAQEEE